MSTSNWFRSIVLLVFLEALCVWSVMRPTPALAGVVNDPNALLAPNALGSGATLSDETAAVADPGAASFESFARSMADAGLTASCDAIEGWADSRIIDLYGSQFGFGQAPLQVADQPQAFAWEHQTRIEDLAIRKTDSSRGVRTAARPGRAKLATDVRESVAPKAESAATSPQPQPAHVAADGDVELQPKGFGLISFLSGVPGQIAAFADMVNKVLAGTGMVAITTWSVRRKRHASQPTPLV